MILTFWSRRVELSKQREFGTVRNLTQKGSKEFQIDQRRNLVETLDCIVSYEHYYHSINGYFTRLLINSGCDMSPELDSFFKIEIEKASRDQFHVTAFSEVDGKVQDFMSIDQNYRVHSNFWFPLPSENYLINHATKYLKLIAHASSSQMIVEEGVFKGFFKYSTVTDYSGNKTTVAEGIRAPVNGLRLELENGDQLKSFFGLSFLNTSRVGQHPDAFTYPKKPLEIEHLIEP